MGRDVIIIGVRDAMIVVGYSSAYFLRGFGLVVVVLKLSGARVAGATGLVDRIFT